MSDRVSDEILDEHKWLFRGVFLRSPDDDWMRDQDEIFPPRPDRVGWECRQSHRNGDTETGYTSWSTNWDTAWMFAEEAQTDSRAPGEVVIFRVRVDTLTNRTYYGRDDEDEILIEGTVEDVEISTGLEDEEEEYE